MTTAAENSARWLRGDAERRVGDFLAFMLGIAAIEAVREGMSREQFLHYATNLGDAAAFAFDHFKGKESGGAG